MGNGLNSVSKRTASGQYIQELSKPLAAQELHSKATLILHLSPARKQMPA
jgi:hypothetical protein